MTTLNDLFPSKYLKASDFDEPTIMTIAMVASEPMKDKSGKEENKPVLYFKEVEKGMVLNVTNGKVISGMYGDEIEAWSGKQVVLQSVEVDAFGEIKPAIRISSKKPVAGKPAGKSTTDPNAIQNFWNKAYSMKMSTEEGNAHLAEFGGDFSAALAALNQPS